jgi:hypothetical protein
MAGIAAEDALELAAYEGEEYEQVGGVQRSWEQAVRPPAGEEDLLVSERAGGGERLLPLPLAGVAADEDERQRPAEPLERPRMRPDEKRQPLDGGVAAEIEENRRGLAEGPEAASR